MVHILLVRPTHSSFCDCSSYIPTYIINIYHSFLVGYCRWNKFPQVWGPHNTVHLDDLQRNFALNPHNGLKVTAYYRKKKPKDIELMGLGTYLEKLALEVKDFTTVQFKYWQDVVAGKMKLLIKEGGDDYADGDDKKVAAKEGNPKRE